MLKLLPYASEPQPLRTSGLPPRETLLGLFTDLVRRSWQKVDASHYLDDYLASQWQPLKPLQMAKLRRLVWHCFLHVPQYRLAEVMSPSEIEDLQTSERLPVFTGAPEHEIATQAERSDEEAAERRRALRMRAEGWAGAPPARVVAVWGREAAAAPRVLSGAEIDAVRVALQGNCLVTGPGSSLGELAAALPSPRRFTLRRNSIVSVIARDGDPTNGGARLAAIFSSRLFKWWTVRELGVVAAPCELAGLHLMADHLLVDVVDGEGRVLPNGVIGRLVLTDLHQFASPWLRRDLGHRGRVLPHACPCGRSLPLVELA